MDTRNINTKQYVKQFTSEFYETINHIKDYKQKKENIASFIDRIEYQIEQDYDEKIKTNDNYLMSKKNMIINLLETINAKNTITEIIELVQNTLNTQIKIQKTIKDKMMFRNIFINKFSNIPLWNSFLGTNFIFEKQDELNYVLHANTEKNNGMHKLQKISNIDKSFLFTFFGSEIFMGVISLFIALYGFYNIIFLWQFGIFALCIIVAYFYFIKYNKSAILILINTIGFLISTIVCFIDFGTQGIYLSVPSYAALYILLTFNIPSLIQKRKAIAELKNNINAIWIFLMSSKRNIYIISYEEDRLSEEEMFSILLSNESKIKDIKLKINQEKTDDENEY